MQMKRLIKVILVVSASVAVGIFLYSHMNVQYSLESGNENVSGKTDELKQSADFPKRFEKEVSDLLTFEADIIVSGDFRPDGFHAALATRKQMDTDRIYSYYMEESESVTSVVHENYMDHEDFKTPITVYEDQGKELSLAAYDFTFMKHPQMNYIQNSFYPSKTVDSYNADRYSTEEDLTFMDRTEAWNYVKKALEETGLDLSAAFLQVVYSLDVETMSQEELCIDVEGNKIDEEKNPGWSKEDEGYYYYITQNYQGVPFYPSKMLEADEETVAPLELFQSESGILFADLKRWFDIEETDELLQFTSIENVMMTIEEKYSGTIHTNPLTVKKAKLYVFPIQTDGDTYSLVPVWVCTLTENFADLGEEAYDNNIYIPINAITGEEMLILENGR